MSDILVTRDGRTYRAHNAKRGEHGVKLTVDGDTPVEIQTHGPTNAVWKPLDLMSVFVPYENISRVAYWTMSEEA